MPFFKICGEDPNCDLGGYHHNPILDYVEARNIQEAEEYGKTLEGWYRSSRYGGFVEEITFTKIDPKSIKKRKELEDEKKRIQNRLSEIEREMKGI